MGPRPPRGIGAVTARTEQGETEPGLGLAQGNPTKDSSLTQPTRELPAQHSHHSCAMLSSACDPLDFSPGSSLTSWGPRGSSLLSWKQ